MSILSSHTNVYNTCLLILRQHGYKLSLGGDLDAEGSIKWSSLVWRAERGEYIFNAWNPIELLGLTAIYEFRHPDAGKPGWWVVDGANIFEELLDEAFPDDDKKQGP